MWWSRRHILGYALSSVAVGLGGCGFQPLYGRPGEQGTASELASIKIQPIPDRIGQILRNDLLERLTPYGIPSQPKYILAVDIRQSSISLNIQSDATITRYNLRLDISFTLVDVATNETIYRDHTRMVGSYDAVRSDFATLSAKQATARRVAREASEEIRTLLAVFFSRLQSSG